METSEKRSKRKVVICVGNWTVRDIYWNSHCLKLYLHNVLRVFKIKAINLFPSHYDKWIQFWLFEAAIWATCFYFCGSYSGSSKVNLSRCGHACGMGEVRYGSSFTTSTLDWGEWSSSLTDRGLPPGEGLRYLLVRRLDGLQSSSGHRD
jgi:hypothetical protein